MSIAISALIGCGSRTGLHSDLNPIFVEGDASTASPSKDSGADTLAPLGLRWAAEKVGLDGQIEGSPVNLSESVQQAFRWQQGTSPDQFGVDFGDTKVIPGLLRMQVQGRIPIGSSAEVSGWIRLPSATLGATFYCFDANVTLLANLSYDLETTSLSLLGRCPGQATQGQVVACASESGNCPAEQTVSTLAGATFTDPIDAWLASFAVGHPEQAYFVRAGSSALTYEVEAWKRDNNFLEALLTVPSGDDQGALYCAGNDSTLRTKSDNGSTVTSIDIVLRNLSRAGRCDRGAPNLGKLSGCIR